MAKFYLTTAIDYSNGDPHVGHALEKIGADVIARYRRLRGDRVHFLMGMDENAQSVIQMSEQFHITPRDWVDQMAERFARFWHRLDLSHDDWIRTTEARHVRAVTELLRRIQANHPDDVYLADYEGLYCTGCEEFKTETQMVEGRCAEHPTLVLLPKRERNHFFRLSSYTDRLRGLIDRGELRIEPAIRRNEILRLIESGLQDISISRSRLPWGIPFPGSAGHTIYVWFDAVINYLAATGFPDPAYESLWPADLHVIGKGITRFHCVLWPAMCLSAGIAPPRMVWGHGYVQWEGAKMSKTAGTAVTLDQAIERHGPDALRYYLMRDVGFASDGDFTWERFDARYLADLADGLGNLVARSTAMLDRYRGGRVPAASPADGDPEVGDRLARYARAMDQFDLKGGLDATWDLVGATDLYISRTAPWSLAKTGDDAGLDRALATLYRALFRIAVLAFPFIPGKARLIWAALGQPDEPGAEAWGQLPDPPRPARPVTRPVILFPKPDQEGPKPAA